MIYATILVGLTGGFCAGNMIIIGIALVKSMTIPLAGWGLAVISGGIWLAVFTVYSIIKR